MCHLSSPAASTATRIVYRLNLINLKSIKRMLLSNKNAGLHAEGELQCEIQHQLRHLIREHYVMANNEEHALKGTLYLI